MEQVVPGVDAVEEEEQARPQDGEDNHPPRESGIKYFYDVTDRVLFPSLDGAVLSF